VIKSGPDHDGERGTVEERDGVDEQTHQTRISPK
jgi:hypothetical protein